MSEVFRIALSGGPCAGKTTIINELNRIYTEKGYNVIVVPESARQILEAGASRDDVLAFQTMVAEHQLENEVSVNAMLSNDVDNLVLYDRGIVDAFGYLNDDDKLSLSKHLGINKINAWSRYEAVIFLETAALSDAYENDTDRCESVQEAVECHNSLLDVWMGHPHLRYIKTFDSIEDKLSEVLYEVESIVNNIEHEKKYLIEYPTDKLFSKYPCFKTEIEQIYLLSDKGSHRIRKRGAGGSYQYFETLKVRLTGDKCIETECTIDADTYEELKSIADPAKHPIVKDRYCLLYNAQYFEVDIFPFWKDRALLELELSHDNQGVDLPPEISVIRDVSMDREYKNNYLAGMNL